MTPPYKSVSKSALKEQMTLCRGKEILHIERKNMRKFVIFSEIMLDIWFDTWYIIQARVGGICGFFPETQKRALR